MDPSILEWPWQYSFPPFFTLQVHADTRSKQVSAWKDLIMWYCQKVRLYTIDLGEVKKLPLFHNTSINRTLPVEVITSILSELEKTGHAHSIDKAKRRWEIYWHTLDEWATIIYDYICQNGFQNSILTLYELTQGDDIQNREWYGMKTEILISILKVLETQNKCELILSDDEQGVKFF